MFVQTKQTQREWQIVFIICAIVYFIGAIFFSLLADGYLQPWATKEALDNKSAANIDNKVIVQTPKPKTSGPKVSFSAAPKVVSIKTLELVKGARMGFEYFEMKNKPDVVEIEHF